MKAVICGALMALVTTSANAAVQDLLTSAKYIIPGCKAFLERGNNADPMKQGFCMGMVIGLASMQQLEKERQDGKGAVQHCFDMPDAEGGPPDQAIKVIVKYADLHPEQLEYSFARIAVTALHEAWPCKK